MGDRISLTVPRARNYLGVAQLVLGGVASRQNFTLEALEDLQVAIEELLERERGDGSVTLELELSDGSLQARVGPFLPSALRADLEPLGERELGLRRVLDSTVDGVEVETRDDGDWVLITKAVHT
jgi:anti-sigma regulatory factor (Ser/Thr protein kinase)